MKKGFLFFLLVIATSFILADTYLETFATSGNWAGGTMTGYNAKTYTNDADPAYDQFSSNSAVRETAYIVTSSPYSWRVNTGAYYFRYECETNVSGFNLWLAKWDSSPVITFTVRYSTDSGSTYTDIETINGGTWFVADKEFKQYSYSFGTPITPEPGEKIYIEINKTAGERLLIDDFTLEYTTGGSGNPLVADFSADETSGLPPLTVNFTDATTGGTAPYTYAWDFQNDSTTDSTEENPSFEYTTTGLYTVKLTVTDSAARTADVEIKVDYINITDYYDSITETSGTALKAQLHELINDHTSYVYDNLNPYLMETDKDPNNPNNCIELYTGESEAAVSSKEHVWAKSHGEFSTTRPAGSDMHNLRPSQSNINSTRNNLDFDNGGTEVLPDAPGNYHDSDSWEPRDAVKGDVARMLFYMATRYEGDVPANVVGEPDLELVDEVDTEDNDGGVAGYGEHGKLSTLLQWHLQDPVDSFEMNRNNVIFTYQGNRNPFIDHPEWVYAIWQPIVDIYDIQYVASPLTDDASIYTGQIVTTTGIVTAIAPTGYFISEPEGGAWKGIFVYDSTNSPTLGDEITITATVQEYNSFTQLSSVTDFNLDSSSNPLPSAVVINTGDLSEAYEGVLVSVEYVTVTSTVDTYNQWSVNDGSGACEIDDLIYNYSPAAELSDDFDSITGVVNYSYGAFDINPRSAADLIESPIINVDPIADAGGPYNGTDSDYDGWADVTLDGSGSTDSDGSIVSYEWSWDDGVAGGSGATDLIISEYVEGSGYNKAIEIYNGTGSTVDLSNYSLKKQVNGVGDFGSELSLSGTLANDDVYVIVSTSGTPNLSAETFVDLATSSACINFNGNDCVALYKAGIQIDVVGVVNQTSSWGADMTLVRNANITSPTVSYNVSDWTQYSSNTFTYLGSHTMTFSKGNRVVQNASGVSPTASFPLGETVVTLTVTDDEGGVDIDTATVTVTEPTANQAPAITNISTDPSNPTSSQSVAVSADITDTDGTISSAEVRWGTATGVYGNTEIMSFVSGAIYQGAIPAQADGTTVYFIIAASDDDSEETLSDEQSYSVTDLATSRVIISEVADPTDYNASYIELFNAGNAPENLRGWTIKQYNSTQTTVLDDVVNTDLVTNMTGEYTLQSGEYAILIRGTLADLLGTYPAFNGYYFVDGSNGAGAPQINGAEYFELFDDNAKAIVDRMGDATHTILADKVYERNDALSNGSDVTSDWTEVSGSTTGTPGISNITPLDNYQILPVEFSFMTAELLVNKTVNLTWKTESESNLSHFLIYRGLSADVLAASSMSVSIGATNDSNGNTYNFEDTEVYSGYEYWYWIEAISVSGTSDMYGPASIKIAPIDGEDNPDINVISTGISSVFPNPFNPSTSIKYSVKGTQNILVEIYNLKGQKMSTLVDRSVNEGFHTVTWDGKDSKNVECSSGIYFIRLISGSTTDTRKAILIK
ncbi:MAG: endonuclease [Candidatus Cloacimonetes bacterium]|nr:endonuclease [Candidatus Cloacimonadota bacterium]